jgi:serine protease AprX
MAERKPVSDRLPIKLILPNQGKEKKVQAGGPPPKPFRTVNASYRGRLVKQVSAILDAVAPQLKISGCAAAPVRVKLITKATAKSHRPEELFSENTCPIIGAGKLGELFLKATPQGLIKLAKKIELNASKQIEKELSCIESIEPLTPSYRRRGVEAIDVLRKSPKGENGFVTRVRLFNFGTDNDQADIVSHFEEVCHSRKINITTAGYSPTSFVYGAECRSVEDVDTLSRVIGVRSVASMPLIRAIHPRVLNSRPLPQMVTRQEVTGDVPVVVVVDSGISTRNADLETWVVGRETTVAPAYRNTDHGTFVAGLICWGNTLNPTVPGIDDNPCAVYDLQVIPNGDPAKGDTDALLEQEFLVSLETALQNHANEFKVWNLSLGTDQVCSLDDFSEFAMELDNLQEKYQVSFVISAGNFASIPRLSYPRKANEIEPGRITTPADSVLGITVGSISHVDYQTQGPKTHELSAFSRHGAGPNYVIKPDLVHYGGACSIDASHCTGIRSLDGNGVASAENLGTSFAAPLVSRTLAQIYHQITPKPNPVLARALLTHHARDPRTQDRVPDGDENYFGFGLPSAVPYCLECSPYTSTLVFDDVLRNGFYLEWDQFPYPPSLFRKGRYFGEIWMTVAFSPARGQRWGSEYCETHIDAHFGVYRNSVDTKTGEVKPVFNGLVPPEHKNPRLLYESYQVAKLRKWAPVRTYHGYLGPKGKLGDRWRLMVRLLTRHNVEDQETFKPQPFSLIITIADPEKKYPVYDEMARIVRTRFQAENLAIRAAARIQSKI